MKQYRFGTEAEFDPTSLGRHLCLNFNAALTAFSEDQTQRINGLLSSYIYDVPQFPNDKVDGGIHYAKYVELPTSLIPWKQPELLKQFSEEIQDLIEPGASFFDLSPGPEWSIRQNTLPALQILQPSSYLPVDLEPDFTNDACKVIAEECPEIEIERLVINFHEEALPTTKNNSSIIWYPGSTLGNLPSFLNKSFLDNTFIKDHLRFLQEASDRNSGSSSQMRYLVLLMDGRKEDVDSMVNLYTSPSAKGCFLSIPFKLKRDLKAQGFDPSGFEYEPVWNDVSSAVDHTFTATFSQEFQVYNSFEKVAETIKVWAGERYVLANSLKPSCDDMKQMLKQSGWSWLKSSTDSDQQFHIHLAQSSTH